MYIKTDTYIKTDIYINTDVYQNRPLYQNWCISKLTHINYLPYAFTNST